jgi:hypothetical protein
VTKIALKGGKLRSPPFKAKKAKASHCEAFVYVDFAHQAKP